METMLDASTIFEFALGVIPGSFGDTCVNKPELTCPVNLGGAPLSGGAPVQASGHTGILINDEHSNPLPGIHPIT